MNKIEQLLNEFCPNWVDLKELWEVIDYEQPTRYLVDSTNYNDLYKTPVLTAWQTFILWYTNEEKWIYNATKESPVIIFDDFTTAFKWVDFNFKAKSSAMKMLTSKNIEEYDLRYVFYAMSCLTYSPQDHARQWIQTYSKIQIPIPPIKIQKEIVKILDTFTLLEAELEAELEARKKQYEYYRNDLLSFADDEVEWKTLNQISINLDNKRKPVTSWDRNSWKYPYYWASWIVDYVDDYIFDGDFLLISEDGANLLARNTPIAFSITGKNWVNNHAHILQFDNYNTRRLVEIYLNSIDLSKYISGAAQPKLNQQNLNKILIPIPYKNWKLDLEKQQEIVSILDKFDALVNDISIWLPAELEVRRQQYEYYRNKLLTFKVLEK